MFFDIAHAQYAASRDLEDHGPTQPVMRGSQHYIFRQHTLYAASRGLEDHGQTKLVIQGILSPCFSKAHALCSYPQLKRSWSGKTGDRRGCYSLRRRHPVPYSNRLDTAWASYDVGQGSYCMVGFWCDHGQVYDRLCDSTLLQAHSLLQKKILI